jgi:hypothetical protein
MVSLSQPRRREWYVHGKLSLVGKDYLGSYLIRTHEILSPRRKKTTKTHAQ